MSRIVAFALALALPLSVHAATFSVNDNGNASDASPGNGVCATAGSVCTLRAALEEANALAGTDTINFSIGSGPQTIAVSGIALPISSSLTIDGTTQPGAGTTPRILLDGGNAVTSGLEFAVAFGLTVTIRGLAIGRFTEAGIKTYQSGTTVRIDHCYIGVGLDGVTDLGNGDGIFARIADLGGSTLILGDAAGGGNVISGNQDMGVEIVDNGPPGAKLGTLTLEGNIIGLGADGMTQVANLSGGIRTNLQFGTITIGGSAAARNIISGNGGGGYITAGFLQADVINFSFNYVGVAQDGITARGNNGTGAVLVGKTDTVDSNIISANTGSGLSFSTSSVLSPIRGNRIGVALDGSPRGNGGAGIVWNGNSGGLIGGPGADQNIIAYNSSTGVRVSGGQAEIAENSIHDNGQLGIDIGTFNVVDANDAGDADTGLGNNVQNHPVVLTAVRSGGATFITGSLGSAPSTSYRIRLFSSTAADPSGFGEGETFLGDVIVNTNAGGNASFNLSTAGAPVGSFVTATATSPSGDTSEFSNALEVIGPPQFRFSAASGVTPESGSVTLTIERVNNSIGSASVNWSTVPGTATAFDFTPSSGTATFASGQISQTINIPITADAVDEIDETFSVALSSPSIGAEIGTPSSETVTITDDDPQPSISIADAATNEGNAGNAPLSFTVTLTAASEKLISVDYVTSNGSATAGSDYAAAAGTLTFAPGETSKSIAIQLVGDTDLELDETFSVTLSNPTDVTIADGVATGTIINDDGMPSITIDDVAVVEGDSGTSIALFTLALSGPKSSTVSVGWSTSDGTATAGEDYESASGTATFAPNATSATIAVTIDGDVLVENNETFFVDLAGPSGATLADSQGGGTIADDDGTPSLSINDPAVVEGMTATFTVTLAPASALPVTVTYATSDLSAVDGSDYSGATNMLTFAPGETSKTIDIATLDDGIAESSEDFRMTLSSPSGATIGDDVGTATIIDDDGPPRVTIGNATSPEGNAGTAPLTFTIDLSHASASTIDVTWTTMDGTATAGSDYTTAGGVVTFAPGEISKTIDVDVLGDVIVESDEMFFVQLTSATNATITDDQGVGTVANDDGSVEVSIANVSAPEGTGGATTFAFDVSLSAASADTITIQWATADVTATAGSDYAAAAGNLIFAPGQTVKPISISVSPDPDFEANETFVVDLLAATNASISDAQATGTIVNDDPAPAVPAISIAPATVTEGNGGTSSLVFAVTLDVPTINTVNVVYATGGGSATAGADYVGTTGTLTFAPGVTAQNVVVPVIGDTLVEGSETLNVTLTSPVNATLGIGSAAGTILDDDLLPVVPSIFVGDVAQLEGDSGATLYVFPVTLAAPTTVAVGASWTTVAGTAGAGTDFVSASGTVVFMPGAVSQTVAVAVNGDDAFESDETFSVQISAPVNAAIADGIGVGTIRNDDHRPTAAPTLTAAGVSIDEGNDGLTEAVVTLTLSSRAASGASVRWMTHAGTATGVSDFVEGSGRITFGSSTTATIPISIVGDRVVEPDEIFDVELFDADGVVLQDDRVEITIRDDDLPSAARAIVLAVGSLRGDAGSHFGTAVQMVNLGAAPAAGSLVIRPAGAADATRDTIIPYALGPGELRSYGDLLAENGLEGLATLDVLPSTGAMPEMTVRIYDDGSGHGTTGFTLPVVTPDDALTPGDEALLIAPDNPSAMRFNVGIRTLDDGATIAIETRDRYGATRHRAAYDFPSNWFNQLPGNDLAGIALSSGDYLVIRVSRGSAILYGASVDNVTNDPSVQVVGR